jgi:hypothetical protein
VAGSPPAGDSSEPLSPHDLPSHDDWQGGNLDHSRAEPCSSTVDHSTRLETHTLLDTLEAAA